MNPVCREALYSLIYLLALAIGVLGSFLPVFYAIGMLFKGDWLSLAPQVGVIWICGLIIFGAAVKLGDDLPWL